LLKKIINNNRIKKNLQREGKIGKIIKNRQEKELKMNILIKKDGYYAAIKDKILVHNKEIGSIYFSSDLKSYGNFESEGLKVIDRLFVKQEKAKERTFHSNPRVNLDERNELDAKLPFSDLKEIGKKDILKKEDKCILEKLIKLAPRQRTITQSGDLTIAALNFSFSIMELNNLVTSKVIMHPRQYSDLRLFGMGIFEESTNRDKLTNSTFGTLWGADILVTNQIPEEDVLLTCPPMNLGYFEVITPFKSVSIDEETEYGCDSWEKLGFSEFNKNGIVLLKITKLK
jgi:hypothetical protein